MQRALDLTGIQKQLALLEAISMPILGVLEVANLETFVQSLAQLFTEVLMAMR
jgi:uncharacterized membrane protein